MADARRGEIWLIDLGVPIGRERGRQRPALVVSSDEWNRHAGVLTVIPLTRNKHGLPTRLEIEPDRDDGLDETSYARCEDIRSVSERRLVHRVGTVDMRTMQEAGAIIRTFLEI